jgi:hypothetical protein
MSEKGPKREGQTDLVTLLALSLLFP